MRVLQSHTLGVASFRNGSKIKEFGSYLFQVHLVTIIVVLTEDSFPLVTYNVCHLCRFYSPFTALVSLEFYESATISALQEGRVSKKKLDVIVNTQQRLHLLGQHNINIVLCSYNLWFLAPRPWTLIKLPF